MTSETPAPRFDSLGLSASLVKAVSALGYEEPTPIQREAIPVLLAGRDLIGQAGTGTGKTAAFALPLLHRLLEPRKASQAGSKDPASIGPRGLILVPTRELAMQVAEAVHKYSKQTSLRVVPVYGGAPMDQQIRSLRRGVDIVVATPGRALDLMRRKALVLDAVAVLVLDEADEMLDMGFAEDLETILTATPDSRQTALFAATMAPRIAAIAENHLTKPARVMIKGEKRAAGKLPRVRQVAFIAARANKAYALGRILEFEEPASAIVFCRTRLEVEELTDTLKSHGYDAQALHGGMEQRQRDRVMAMFRQEQAHVLVATDVAARGLDIDHVSHVINYDIPTSPEVYVHRIGRTGRIGREGVAITLVDPREQRLLRQIEGLTRQPIEVAPLPTEAALQAKRLSAMRAAIEERIKAGELDGPRAFVAELAHNVDILDIAAAAVSLLQDGGESEDDDDDGDHDDRGPVTHRGGSAAHREGPAAHREGPADQSGRPMTLLWVGAGRTANIRPGDLVGAITSEARLDARELGKITITPSYSLVELPEALADRVIRALQKTTLRGQRVEVRRDRGRRT
ncbi:MAG TPA: DEAD/DEAH box helicase [Vicinamibacterales bacterium]|nr:DEAD/DEAH box helicase [Vicinamibacterales bacterium]